jgi:hypothetical protein
MARLRTAPIQIDIRSKQSKRTYEVVYNRKSNGTKYKKHRKNPARRNQLELLAFPMEPACKFPVRL